MWKLRFNNNECDVKVAKIRGIRSPTTTRYDTPTPKHFTAIAKSNTTLNCGYVICDSAKNEAFRSLAYFDTRACSIRPVAEHAPQKTIMQNPNTRPNGLNAYGMARIPAPHAVWSKVKTPEPTEEDIAFGL